MSYSLLEVMQVTIVSMLVVFACLTGIMLIMMLTGKLLHHDQTEVATSETPDVSNGQSVSNLALVEQDELAKVAVITALAHAAKQESGKQFEVVSVERKA